MSKKRDPVLGVLKYFQETELSLAQQALTLATAIVKTRAPAPRPRAVVKKAAAAVAAPAAVVTQ